MINSNKSKRDNNAKDNSTNPQTLNSFKTQRISSMNSVNNNDFIDVNEDIRLSMPLPMTKMMTAIGLYNDRNQMPLDHKSSNTVTGNIFDSVSCKNIKHNQLYLSFDIKKMCIICLKCKEEGKTGYQLETIQRDSIKSNTDNKSNEKQANCLKANCLRHPSFFCKDCKGPICYQCLLTQHIAHQANSIQYLSNSFKDYLRKIANELNKQIEDSKERILSKQTDNNSNQINKLIFDFINKFASVIESGHDKINKTLVSFRDLYYREFCEAFQSNDKVANEIDLTISKLQLQYADNEHVLTDLLSLFTNYDINNVAKCEMKQKSKEQLDNINLMIKETKDTFDKLNKLNQFTQDNKEIVSISQKNTLKSIFELESSLMFSIKRGCIGNTITLDRLTSFKHNSMLYFKTSSISLIASSDIELLGINVCGLYIEEDKLANPNYEINQLENRDSIDVNITVSSIKENNANDDEYEILTKDKMRLYGIVNTNDPLVSLYFPSLIHLIKDKSYIISIDNLNFSNSYVNLWTGSKSSNTISSLSQDIKCNTTGINVKFSSIKNNDLIQSDFDEFSMGIIGGIIYSI